MKFATEVAYVIQQSGGGVVKVGVSKNPFKRVMQIRQTVPFEMELIALISDGKTTEKEMKSLLEPWKQKGEWFAPRPELNEYLVRKKKQNALLTSIEMDEEFSENFLKPYVHEHLGTRQPLMNYAGDLVFRYMHLGFVVIRDRLDEFNLAVNKLVPPHLLMGLVPLPSSADCPAVEVPASQPEAVAL